MKQENVTDFLCHDPYYFFTGGGGGEGEGGGTQTTAFLKIKTKKYNVCFSNVSNFGGPRSHLK